MHKIVHNCHTQ